MFCGSKVIRKHLELSTMDVTSQLNSLHYPLKMDGEDMEKELLKPFNYLASIPGKRLRVQLIQVLEQWITVSEDKIQKIEELAYYAHNATLLIDDIQDNSKLRRGRPTAHTVYGTARTLHAVNVAQSYFYDLLDQFHDTKLTAIFMKAVVAAYAGQGMEIYWRDNCICPTEEEYFEMVYKKTCLMLLTPYYLMNTFSTGKRVDATKLLTTLGIYMQINNDYQNLQNQLYYDCKGFCEDITEGKFSYPVIHAINNFPKEGKKIINILRERTYDVQLKKQCLSILEQCGSFKYTENKLKELQIVVYAEVAKLDKNPLIDDFLNKSMITYN